MTKLTARQIVQLHTMRANGASNGEIARTLGLNRNSVTAHLAGEIAYPSAIYKSIALHAPLLPLPWMTIRQAAAWIPGHPSASKMQILIAGRSWRGREIPKLRSKIVGRRRMTTIAAIRAFVRQVYPQGIWLTENTLMACFEYRAIERIPLERIGWFKGAPFGSPLYAAHLPVAVSIAREADTLISVPAELVHRATTIVSHIGTAVI